ncbi:MAG: hypothetical protein K2M60_03020, partial [Lachnospiraceae bacterium]|nr:hypothetical protein [Lachnospiraceae bacterium]
MAPKTISTSVGVGTGKANSMGSGTGNNDLPPAGSDAEDLDPVNMAMGEYIYEDKDFILPDMNGEYSLTRRCT